VRGVEVSEEIFRQDLSRPDRIQHGVFGGYSK